MPKHKIINDPVYGFIRVPYGLLFTLMEHPYFQRLRRIKQTGLTEYVYPGALHTRFHHALGALHLMRQAIGVLREKGVCITDEEAEGVQAAILLHDIGHGPYSHTLEHSLLSVSHEEVSLRYMNYFNRELSGALDVAISIFKNTYPKAFLHQLVSGQLDMDRLDYLNRDSFYTGVSEGVIGYDRIIEMLNVHDDQLVMEEKGVLSIEKFLIARRLMYWQVYLHKTVLAAEQMLKQTLKRATDLVRDGKDLSMPESLAFFLRRCPDAQVFDEEEEEILGRFASMDDTDVMVALKSWQHDDDEILSYLAKSLVHREIFRLIFVPEVIACDRLENARLKVKDAFSKIDEAGDYLVISGHESNRAYSTSKEEILILNKDGTVAPMSERADLGIKAEEVTKYFLCYPKAVILD